MPSRSGVVTPRVDQVAGHRGEVLVRPRPQFSRRAARCHRGPYSPPPRMLATAYGRRAPASAPDHAVVRRRQRDLEPAVPGQQRRPGRVRPAPTRKYGTRVPSSEVAKSCSHRHPVGVEERRRPLEHPPSTPATASSGRRNPVAETSTSSLVSGSVSTTLDVVVRRSSGSASSQPPSGREHARCGPCTSASVLEHRWSRVQRQRRARCTRPGANSTVSVAAHRRESRRTGSPAARRPGASPRRPSSPRAAGPAAIRGARSTRRRRERRGVRSPPSGVTQEVARCGTSRGTARRSARVKPGVGSCSAYTMTSSGSPS